MGREHHKRHRDDEDTSSGVAAPSSPTMDVSSAPGGEAVPVDSLKQQLHLLQQQVEKLQNMKLQYLPHQSIIEGISDPLTSYELEVLRNENASL